MCVCLCAQLCLTLCEPARLLWSMGFPRQEYWSGLHFLLQGIFLTQGLNPCLLHVLHWQVDSSPLSHLGSLYIVNSTEYLGSVYPVLALNSAKKLLATYLKLPSLVSCKWTPNGWWAIEDGVTLLVSYATDWTPHTANSGLDELHIIAEISAPPLVILVV